MLSSCIGTDAAESSGVSWKLEQVTFNSVRGVLPDRVIERACRDCHCTYRHRVLTPVVTVLHMILSAVWPEESFQASWDLLWDTGAGAFTTFQGRSPSSGSVSKARLRLPMEVWRRVWDFLAARVQDLSEPFARGRGHRVVLVDGTCVSMPAPPGLFEHFGSSTGCGGKRHSPLARMVTVALAQTMAILAFSPALATAPLWKLPTIYEAMLREIASPRVPRRPGPLEPRAVRREKKHYPRLRCTRDQWRQRIAA